MAKCVLANPLRRDLEWYSVRGCLGCEGVTASLSRWLLELSTSPVGSRRISQVFGAGRRVTSPGEGRVSEEAGYVATGPHLG